MDPSLRGTGREAVAAVGSSTAPRMGPTDAGKGEKSENNHFRFYTENTTLLVTTLVDFSRENSLKMNILNVRPPSLEDAFVRLTEEKNREK